jgi:hypothetical protein
VTDPTSFDPSTIDVSGAISLVIARRSGKNFKGYRIAMHTDVEAELRTICNNTLASLSGRTGVAYSDDLALDVENQYMVVPSTMLVAHRPESRRGRRAADAPAEPPQIEVDAGARKVLTEASSLQELHASELKNQSFVFYAAVVGDEPDHRVAFVDKWNPYKAGMSGQLTTFFGDRLRRIDGPLLVFERSFDMVVTDDTIAVLKARSFEEVFRDIDFMVDRIPVWSGAAVIALPLDDETAARFQVLSAAGGRFAKQLRGMYERGVFELTITTTKLRAEMTRQRLDADRYIVEGKLSLDDNDIPIVLKLIDEKLYRGWLTETPWDVGTRSKRST